MVTRSRIFKRSRIWKIGLLVVLLGLSLIAATPWLLSTPPAHRWLTSRVDQFLAPNHLRFQSLRISWFGPTVLTNLHLGTAAGKDVVSVPEAFWDRNLWSLVTDSGNLGILTLSRAKLTVERNRDESIDLVNVLGPILKPDPRKNFRLKIVDGTLTVTGLDGLAPVSAQNVALDLDLPAAWKPLTWQLTLIARDLDKSQLQMRGKAGRRPDPRGNAPDLDVVLKAKSWPFGLSEPLLGVQGDLEGELQAQRLGNHWNSSGSLQVSHLRQRDTRFSPTTVLKSDWRITQTSQGWMRGLDDHVSLRGDGNVGEFANLWRSKLGDFTDRLNGDWSLTTSVRSVSEVLAIEGNLEAPNLVFEGRDAVPLTLNWQASTPQDLGRLDIATVRLASGNSALQFAGQVQELWGGRLADLSGTWNPDWSVLNRYLNENVEAGASVAGHGGTFRLQGRLSGQTQTGFFEGLTSELRLTVDRATLFGMTLGTTPIGLRTNQGELAIDPIRSTLNGGTLHLDPEWVARTETGTGPILRLKPGSGLEDAEINDAVSRRVLAFVAPILDSATRAHGKVSAEATRAEFPVGPESGGKTLVEGRVIFREVEFVPGPLVTELVRIVGKREAQAVRLDQPVVLSIDEGRVHQRGLALPLGPSARIELEGSVGFDRTLNLRATVPLGPEFLADRPLLNRLASGTRFVVPIGGTLDQPKIDKDAFNLALRQTGQAVLQRGLGLGAAGLLEKMLQPREVDPNAPPKPTVEERRALREHRQAERRQRRAERRGEVLP